MCDNIFFKKKDLKYVGKNVIIGKTVRIRSPHLVSIGDNCIIDDFTYISTELVMEGYNHISAGCKIIGGSRSSLIMKPFSTLSPNVVVSAGSDDYIGGVATPLVPEEYKGNVKYGKIIIGRHSLIGSSSVLLPNIIVNEGAAVGALSLVDRSLEEWTLFAGIPVKKIRLRDKVKILELENSFLKNQ